MLGLCRDSMDSPRLMILLLLIVACSTLNRTPIIAEASNDDVFLWPMPASVFHGSTPLTLAADFQFSVTGTTNASQILAEAFDRYHDIVFLHQDQSSTSQNPESSDLVSLLVDVSSSDETLRYGTDESYTLQIPDPNNSSRAYIEANTVYGALHGLETFSQLCAFNFTTRTVQVAQTPWSISDKPRFPYRGLLIDTSRHYQPLRVIKKVIDAMSYTKLNVLHWHIVDTQSFPLEIPSYPNLWDGAYSAMERYTFKEAQEIVQYARKRGINIMPEIDVPGHARSWGVGYPELWPSSNCTQPLDVSRESTFRVIDGILSDFSKVFTFDFVHMGGDEVDTECWSQTEHTSKWLAKKNFTGFDAYKYFVLKAESMALSHGYNPVNWEEPFDKFGNQLDKRTIIHNWLQGGVAPKVVKAGFRCIVSDQDVWYLDHLDVTWDKFYMNEPLTNITDFDEQKLVIGGEVCMWGETVDPSDIEQTIWPRAAAAAERLWSPVKHIPKDPSKALTRLQNFRCLLDQRGIAAGPVNGTGRSAPDGPGSFYVQ